VLSQALVPLLGCDPRVRGLDCRARRPVYLRPVAPWPGATTVEPDVGATGFSPVASAATKLVVMSALARRQRRAALPGVFELGISDMGCRSFRESYCGSGVEAWFWRGRSTTVAQYSIISTDFMIIIL
jgi:hypothetical protein